MACVVVGIDGVSIRFGRSIVLNGEEVEYGAD